MSEDILRQAFASTGEVLAGVQSDDMQRPTPCASWRVCDLVEHVVGGTTFFAEIATNGRPPEGGIPRRATGEAMEPTQALARFRHGARRAVAAFATPGAMEKEMTTPLGVLHGSQFVWIASVDTFTHGWDLARATGQPGDLDPGLAARLLEVARAALPDELRGEDGTKPFGPRVDVDPGAGSVAQLVGFLGRHPDR